MLVYVVFSQALHNARNEGFKEFVHSRDDEWLDILNILLA